ncbi:peptidoglycan DD-metalloendopeptidase family protein [Chitinibacteraceae bacterium HSL-7]
MPDRIPLFLLALLLAACSSTPAPIVKGGGDSYRVRSGDTLYRIARAHGRSVGELARWNQLSDPADIRVGQVLVVRPPSSQPRSPGSTTSTRPATPRPTPTPVARGITLQRPVSGAVLGRFDGKRSKGVQFAGQRGEPVKAAAAGSVVYAGTGIRNYGRLIIIKHDETWLTAYAHNDTLVAKEGQRVAQGQTIATMGDSGATRVMLHFELRRNGNAVDPMPYIR